MITNFIEELRWRGMLQDIMPGTEELLLSQKTKGYIGFDPTADSLGIGNMVQVMTLLHFQKCGHIPVALVGGATGMVGDPSGKSAERNLLDEEKLKYNLECQEKQLKKFLDFETTENPAILVNNFDWFKEMKFLSFIRDVGKHITVNYMMAKDSVKKRLQGEDREGMSFTEFTYQLIQGYDFYYLWKNHGIKLQMGGSDQWGNIVTGTELIRKKDGGEAFALTTPLIKKADGTKFGKTESGNIWLDKSKTSAYKFYQFWLNAADEDVENFIKIFSVLNKEDISHLVNEHKKAPHLRILQKELAKEITTRVHSETDYLSALEASEILFGKTTGDALKKLNEEDFLAVFEGVPQSKIDKNILQQGINFVELLVDKSSIFPSRGEARKMISGGGVLLNKEKVENPELTLNSENLINNKFIIVQRGKKNYYLIIAE